MPSGQDADAIGIASDHAGFELKELLRRALLENDAHVVDLGPNNAQSVDYPDFAYALAQALRAGEVKRGVLVCGSGIGISMAANRYINVRAALVHDVESARLARLHNDANVICFGGRRIDAETATACLRVFLSTEFEGGRHSLRVEKLSKPW